MFELLYNGTDQVEVIAEEMRFPSSLVRQLIEAPSSAEELTRKIQSQIVTLLRAMS